MTKYTFQKLAVLVALSPAALWGYELRTHAEVTASAFDRSMLAQSSQLAKNLGLDTANTNTLGEKFFYGPASTTKVLSPFERNQMRKGIEDTSISGWLMRGAIREDDLTPLGCAINSFASKMHGRTAGECNPPGTNADRVLNHFFDPISRRGFNPSIVPVSAAPNWATGAADSFSSPNAPGNSGNRFTLMDARRAMYYALSGSQADGSRANEDERKAWWATAFYALGGALYLVQDMAQPQHTRNELHMESVPT